jgi:hypothetical protein
MGVFLPPQPTQSTFKINLTVFPAIPVFDTEQILVNSELNIKPIPISLVDALINTSRKLIKDKIDNYFDEDRVGKTLLNFGQDYQLPIVNWQFDPEDQSGRTILVKSYSPLPNDIDTLTELWIDRELSPTMMDQLFVVFIPGEGLKVYLRPPNRDINVRSLSGNEVNNVTLQSLLTTGSFDVIKPSDPILEEWFVTSLEGAELNIDYSDFSNFAFYSSVYERVQAFKEKLVTIENYNSIIQQQSSSIASVNTGLAGFTSAHAYPAVNRIGEQRFELIRSFDGFERFLYYGSGSAYSSSFSNDELDTFYYLGDVTWPKINGSLISVASASNADLYSVIVNDQVLPGLEDQGLGYVAWLDAIEYIAAEYDVQNSNRLANNLPDYLINDVRSSDFIKFVDLIGHHFDILKSYADGMPSIYDRSSDPASGLSEDMIWNVAAAFGIDLPNEYAVKKLVEYTIGEIGIPSAKVYKQVAAETWKRFLHNHIYLTKSKGTKSALRGLLNSYGVLPSTIQIRETATPTFFATQSYELIEEQTNAVNLRNGSYVVMPFTSSVLPGTPQTLQVRFATTNPTRTTIVHDNQNWSIQLIPISNNIGRIAYVTGSVVSVLSSAFPIYDGTFYNTTINNINGSVTMSVQQADDDGDIIRSSITTGSVGMSWATGSNIILGMSGTIPFNTGFVGQVDEFRLWSEVLTPAMVELHTKYPGLYNGNLISSARDNLLVRLSFNKPNNLGSPIILNRFLLNESPLVRLPGIAPQLLQFSAFGFPNEPSYPNSMEVVTRNVLRFAPNAGGSQYVSNKITIVDKAVHRSTGVNNVPVLSPKKSMVTIEQKQSSTQPNNVVGFFFSITEAINDNIIRSIGNIDIQDYIGDPSSMYDRRYTTLDELNKLYWSNYAYSYNYNSFVDFVDNLLQPMFQQAKELIPARAKLLSGIVIESHILERNKIQWKPLEVTGLGTFNNDVTPTLEAIPVTSQPSVIVGTYDTYTTLISQPLDTSVISSYNTLDSIIQTPDLFEIDSNLSVHEGTVENTAVVVGSYNSYQTKITGFTDVTDLDGTFLYVDDETARLDYIKFLLRRFNAVSIIQLREQDQSIFNQLMLRRNPRGRYGIDTGINPYVGPNPLESGIEPYINFDRIGTTTYFTQPLGIVSVPTKTKVRVNQNSLTAAGIWNIGSIYTAGQYVTQSMQTGLAEEGNNIEYTCVTPLQSGSFRSRNPPSLDINNWRRTKYTLVNTRSLKVVTLLNNNVELVNTNLGYTPFVGYVQSHYRFRRDTRLGTLRRLWLGCKQTNQTTIDGGPAVEIIPSAGDILVVTTGASPIQKSTDSSGPRLDVK